ncbi:hypothetical protein Ahy_B01g057022 [Arachis hypogaea]|uniref:Uncharacterized protein n=1 Tax=Arachis hypogaea TaxID=3818 RepID=A0A445B076_ARAHY|nr:hypothetical protein Ahy_B01g057022 [Arachis hypogaea]
MLSGTQKSGRRGIFLDRDGARTTVECLLSRTRKVGRRGIFPKEGGARTSVECVKHDAPSFDLGISLPTSQTTSPTSQLTVTQLEILAEAVIDARVAAALKFADATSVEPNFAAAEVYKTPEKEKEITELLMEKCYNWITHVVNAHCMILNDIKCPQFQEEIHCVPTDIVVSQIFYSLSSFCRCLCWETMTRITLIQRPIRPTRWMSISMPTTAVFLTKENSHRVHL